MKCVKCGGEIMENANFCKHCGAKVEQIAYGNDASKEWTSEMLSKLESARGVVSEAYDHLTIASDYEQKAEEFRVKKEKFDAVMKFNGNISGVGVFIGFFFAPIVIVVLPIVIIWLMVHNANLKSGIRDNMEKCDSEVAAAQSILVENMDTISFLDPYLWNPKSIAYLIKLLSDHRVNNWSEALNMGETYTHRTTVEDADEYRPRYMKCITSQICFG